jgi:hypothetical protein
MTAPETIIATHFISPCSPALKGLPCAPGRDCYCKPCVNAYEVDIYPLTEDIADFNEENYTKAAAKGCEKMSLCGTVEQTKTIVFHAYDNQEREGATVRAVMHVGAKSEELEVTPINNTWAYEFSWSRSEQVVAILEVYVDDEQIPESPIRVQVVERNCNEEFEGQGKEADGA